MTHLAATELSAHEAPASIAVPALQVDGVSHSYGSRVALADVSFAVPQGGFTALLGLNGAGKSTLFSLDYATVRDQAWSHFRAGFRIEPGARRGFAPTWSGVSGPHARP